jgi:hypothetical protein
VPELKVAPWRVCGRVTVKDVEGTSRNSRRDLIITLERNSRIEGQAHEALLLTFPLQLVQYPI